MPSAVEIIVVPYDSGKRAYRMGAGPIALVDDGIADVISGLGCEVTFTWVESASGDALGSAVEHAEEVAGIVKSAQEGRRFPVVLAGNCMATVGAFAGASESRTGLAWFDAHADLNTPETSPSGFLDGMAVAALLGWCHSDAFVHVRPRWTLAERNLLLVGGRSFDPAEQQAIASGAVALLTPAEASAGAARANLLAMFKESIDDLYVHFDLDVLDPEQCGAANSFSAPDGLSVDTVATVVRELVSDLPLVGITVSAYDPTLDDADRVSGAALRLIGEAVTLAREATS